MSEQSDKCFICDHNYCGEDSDHLKMTYQQFNSLMQEKAGYNLEIANLKFKVTKAFQKLENYSKISYESQKAHLCLLVDKLHFWHLLQYLPTLKDVQAAIFGYMLTKSQIIQLICLLMNDNRKYQSFPAFSQLFSEIHKFKRSIKKSTENVDQVKSLWYKTLINKFSEIIQREEQARRKRKYKCGRPGGPDSPQIQISHSQTVQMEGIPFNTERTSLDLSILSVDDRLLYKILPSLEKIKGLKEFHLRNNRLTIKGFKILFNALPCLQSIDLSNSNSDNFLHLLPKYLPNLKALYLNEAKINTKEKIEVLVYNFDKLKVLFLNSNNIDFQMIESLAERKPSLFYVTLRNNRINSTEARILENKFLLKGGYFQI